MSRILKTCKQDLLDIYKCAVEAVGPERLIKSCVKLNSDRLVIDDPVDSSKEPIICTLKDKSVHVIGGGKCVLAMARGLADLATQSRVSNLFSNGCLSVPIHSRSSFEQDLVSRGLLKDLDISVEFGSKDNLPDLDSVNATNCIMRKISEACKIDGVSGRKPLFLVLLSGGGSACLTSPNHISLQDKLELIQELVRQGADIVELNTVRKCFSQIKGGNLARHIHRCNPDSEIVTLILSDVINDPIEFIASGPTFLGFDEADMHRSMVEVLTKYGLNVPKHPVSNCTNDNPFWLVKTRVIGNNQLALNAIEQKASQLGYNVTNLGNNLSGSTTDVCKHILNHAGGRLEPSLVVAAGESTVRKGLDETWGVGGRVQEMALDYMLHRLSSNWATQNNVHIDVFLAGSTDGQDGPTDVAGCLASASEWTSNKTFSLEDAIRAKKTHDAYNFWSEYQPDWLIKTGPSGTNVMDLYMLMTVKSETDKA